MDKIKEVKERANIVEVARYLNIHLNHANKAVCPFHKEKTASFSISTSKQIYKCFGCGKGGDVISLVSELVNINALEAAKLVNDICNCGVDFNAPVNKHKVEQYKQKKSIEEQFKKWIRDTENVLLNYYRILRNSIMENTDLNKLELDIKEFTYVNDLLSKLEEYPVLLWKYERKKVEEFERRYKQRRID